MPKKWKLKRDKLERDRLAKLPPVPVIEKKPVGATTTDSGLAGGSVQSLPWAPPKG